MDGKTRARWQRLDRLVVAGMILAALGLAAKGWLDDHPEHNPWAPLALDDPMGWATGQKISALRDDVGACRLVLERGEVAFAVLDPAGTDACLREDRTVLQDDALSPASPQMTCPTAAGYEIWMRHVVQPAARDLFDSEVRRVEHLGTYNCRRIGGGETGNWSEHATGNAIDIAGFVLENGQRISVLGDWTGEGAGSEFLHSVRDGACTSFATVLSPDYNAAHADHLHLDQAARMIGGACR